MVGAVDGAAESAPARDDAQVAVERGGVTRFVNRCDITHVEAQGDYARLHTATESHLLRSPLTTLEEEWASAGFVRIHRSLLVSLVARHARCGWTAAAARSSSAPPQQQGVELGVSRRHTRELRELLLASRTVGP